MVTLTQLPGGIQVPSPDPKNLGGRAMAENFEKMLQWHPKSVWDKTADPTIDDDVDEGFQSGSLWLNTSSGKLWLCQNAADDAAVWIEVGGASDPTGTDSDTFEVDRNEADHLRVTGDGIERVGSSADLPLVLSPKGNGAIQADGNVDLNGHWLSGDGEAEGIFIDVNGNVGIAKNDPTDKLDIDGTVIATGFSGSGAALTNLDGSNISNGTIADVRLSASVQDAISKKHIQNTDTGTTNLGFQVNSEGQASGPGINSFQCGSDNEQSGQKSTQSGFYNVQSGDHSIQIGFINTQSSNYSSQSGYGNTQEGNYCFQSGLHNDQLGSSHSQVGFYNSQSGLYNSQSGSYNTQSGFLGFQAGSDNTQSGYLNNQTGSLNVQNGSYGTQSGKNLNDNSNDYSFMFGFDKTASVDSAMYFWIDNGIRIKPVASAPASPEDGTFYYDNNEHAMRLYANGSWQTMQADMFVGA